MFCCFFCSSDSTSSPLDVGLGSSQNKLRLVGIDPHTHMHTLTHTIHGRSSPKTGETRTGNVDSYPVPTLRAPWARFARLTFGWVRCFRHGAGTTRELGHWWRGNLLPLHRCAVCRCLTDCARAVEWVSEQQARANYWHEAEWEQRLALLEDENGACSNRSIERFLSSAKVTMCGESWDGGRC